KEIAEEKAGIIKEKIPVVIGEFTQETKKVFDAKASVKNAPVYYASFDENIPDLDSDLKGIYQKKNKKTAYKALQLLKVHFDLTEQHIKTGFLRVGENTGLKGRWSILGEKPLIVTDTAHNKNGLELVMQQVRQHKYENLYIVFGVVNDKDIEGIISLLPREAMYFVAKPNVPRGLDAVELKNKLKDSGFKVQALDGIPQALQHAKSVATSNDMIYIGGSTFVVSEVFS